jgi:hypothetical protein
MTQIRQSVGRLFEPASQNPKLAELLGASYFRVQVKPLDEAAFSIRIGRDGYSFDPSAPIADTDNEAISIVEVKPCLKAIFEGEATLGNMLFEHRIQIPGYRNKEPLIGAFSRLVRLAVWAEIPGAAILRPAR